MKTIFRAVFLLVFLVDAVTAATTKIRSGQIDFSEGINQDLKVSGDFLLDGTAYAEVASVTGEVIAAGRLSAGDATNSLSISISCLAFNTWIESGTQSGWLYDSTNLTAYPNTIDELETGILPLRITPGTRLYQVVVHGVFADAGSEHQVRARVYKQNIADPAGPSPLTSEEVQDGGTAGPFSLTLTPDYVVEGGYTCLVRVQLKNHATKKALLFGVEVILHQTQY